MEHRATLTTFIPNAPSHGATIYSAHQTVLGKINRTSSLAVQSMEDEAFSYEGGNFGQEWE